MRCIPIRFRHSSYARILVQPWLVLTILCSVFLPGMAIALAGPPTTSNPVGPVAIHGLVEEAKKLQEVAIAADSECTKLYEQMKKSGAKPDAVGKLAMNFKRLGRIGHRLMDLGEPSGAEFRARYEKHKKEFEEAFSAFQGTPQAASFKAKAIANLQKNTPKRKKLVAEIASKLESDPVAAEAMFDKGTDEHEAVAGILGSTERGSYGEYLDVETPVRNVMKAHRENVLNEAIAQTCSKIGAEMDGFLQATHTAIGAMKDGKITWKESAIEGPDFVDRMMQEGFVVQTHLQKAASLQYLVAAPSGGYVSGPPPALDPQWATRINALRTELGKGAIQVIETDFKQPIDGQRGQAKLAQYVQVLGKYAHRIKSDEWIQSFDEAVLNAAKQVGVHSKVQAYQSATQDLLLWKERFATKQESTLSGKVDTMTQVISKATRRMGADPGYILIEQNIPPYPRFYDSTLDTLPSMVQKLGKEAPAIVKNVVRFDGENPIWVSRWDNYMYAMLPKNLIVAEHSAPLEKALMVSDTAPAMSVRAASAIQSAKRGDGLTVGGMIGEVTVEGAMVRGVSMPDIAAPFFGIDYPAVFPRDQVTMTAALRASVTPVWYRHRYFAVTGLGK